MNIIPIKTKFLQKEPIKNILHQIKKEGIPIENGDVLVFTSKIISQQEKRLVELNKIKPSKKAIDFSKKYKIDKKFCQLIINESDKIISGTTNAILTFKNNILIANAGIDLSNAPKKHAYLWPKSPTNSAEKIKKTIKKEFNKSVGIIISDSHCSPARLGTTALAIAVAGFEPVKSEIGELDLFDKPIKITYHNLADELACTANFLMGESNQKIPAVLIKKANITLSGKSAKVLTNKLLINKNKDLFNKLY